MRIVTRTKVSQPQNKQTRVFKMIGPILVLFSIVSAIYVGTAFQVRSFFLPRSFSSSLTSIVQGWRWFSYHPAAMLLAYIAMAGNSLLIKKVRAPNTPQRRYCAQGVIRTCIRTCAHPPRRVGVCTALPRARGCALSVAKGGRMHTQARAQRAHANHRAAAGGGRQHAHARLPHGRRRRPRPLRMVRRAIRSTSEAPSAVGSAQGLVP
jgi:hypothetical protein